MSVLDNMLLAAPRPAGRAPAAHAHARPGARRAARGARPRRGRSRCSRLRARRQGGRLCRHALRRPAQAARIRPRADDRAAAGPARRADGRASTRRSARTLLDYVEALRRSGGITFLFVEHDMDVVMTPRRPRDRHGARAASSRSGTPAAIRADPRVIDAYLGSPAARRRRMTGAPRRARARGRCLGRRLRPEVDILNGLSHRRRARARSSPCRPQRRRQVDAYQDPGRAAAAEAAAAWCLRGPATSPACGRAPSPGWASAMCRSARTCSRSLTVQENLELGAAAAAGALDLGRGWRELYGLFPRLPSAGASPPAPCRAASARWWPWRARCARAQHPAARRALGRPRAAPSSTPCSSRSWPINRARRHDPDGRAERPPRARHLRTAAMCWTSAATASRVPARTSSRIPASRNSTLAAATLAGLRPMLHCHDGRARPLD